MRTPSNRCKPRPKTRSRRPAPNCIRNVDVQTRRTTEQRRLEMPNGISSPVQGLVDNRGNRLSFTFVHAADIHLDSPLRGLERYESAPAEKMRLATREAFENLVQYCVTEKVDFLLLAGDLYDGDWRDYNTGHFFLRQMGLLRDAGIPVFIVWGNHDAENAMTKKLSPLENMHVFPSKKAETKRLEELNVSIHGQSYGKKDVSDDLSESYPSPDAGCFNIGLLHTSADGRSPEHARYAPCSIEALTDKGYGYWALGHVHKRDVLRADPHIVFPGNLQGRFFRETGPKGATVVRVSNGRVTLEEHPFWRPSLGNLRGSSCGRRVAGRRDRSRL